MMTTGSPSCRSPLTKRHRSVSRTDSRDGDTEYSQPPFVLNVSVFPDGVEDAVPSYTFNPEDPQTKQLIEAYTADEAATKAASRAAAGQAAWTQLLMDTSRLEVVCRRPYLRRDVNVGERLPWGDVRTPTPEHRSHGAAVQRRLDMSPSEFGTLIHSEDQWVTFLFECPVRPSTPAMSKAFDNWVETGVIAPFGIMPSNSSSGSSIDSSDDEREESGASSQNVSRAGPTIGTSDHTADERSCDRCGKIGVELVLAADEDTQLWTCKPCQGGDEQ